MTERSPDTNPLNFPSPDEISLFWKDTDPEHRKYYTGMFREQNSFNPLIDAYIKRMGRIDRDTLSGLNSTYFNALRFIREGILQPELWRVLQGMENLWKEFHRESITFSDFIEFKGIFAGCRWIWKEGPDNELIHDVIFNGDHFDGWKEFISIGDKPLWELGRAFGLTPEEVGNPEAAVNPLAKIITREPDEALFESAKKYLEAKAFLKQPQNVLKNEAPYSSKPDNDEPIPASGTGIKDFAIFSFTPEQKEQWIFDIVSLQNLCYYHNHLSEEKRPKEDIELIELYYLRDNVPLEELRNQMPSKTPQWWKEHEWRFLPLQQKESRGCRRNEKGQYFDYDNEIRITADGKLWGTVFSTPCYKGQEDKHNQNAEAIATGEIIPDFQRFLYERFEPLLNFPTLFKHKTSNPFHKIATKDYRPVTLCDLWDALDFLKRGDVGSTLEAPIIKTIAERINDLWEVLSAIELISTPNETHTYYVSDSANTDKFKGKVAAIQEFLRKPSNERPSKTKEVVITSIDILGWIIWNIEDDWEIKKHLNNFINEFQLPLRKEYTLATAIEDFRNRPQPGKPFIGNEPTIESLGVLYQYLYFTFQELYMSKTAKLLFNNFATKNQSNTSSLAREPDKGAAPKEGAPNGARERASNEAPPEAVADAKEQKEPVQEKAELPAEKQLAMKDQEKKKNRNMPAPFIHTEELIYRLSQEKNVESFFKSKKINFANILEYCMKGSSDIIKARRMAFLIQLLGDPFENAGFPSWAFDIKDIIENKLMNISDRLKKPLAEISSTLQSSDKKKLAAFTNKIEIGYSNDGKEFYALEGQSLKADGIPDLPEFIKGGVEELVVEYSLPISNAFDKRVEESAKLNRENQKRNEEPEYETFGFHLDVIFDYAWTCDNTEEIIKYFKWILVQEKLDEGQREYLLPPLEGKEKKKRDDIKRILPAEIELLEMGQPFGGTIKPTKKQTTSPNKENEREIGKELLANKKSISQHKNLSKSILSYERIGRNIFGFEGDYKTVVAHTRKITDRYKRLLVHSPTHKRDLFRIDKNELADLWRKESMPGEMPELD